MALIQILLNFILLQLLMAVLLHHREERAALEIQAMQKQIKEYIMPVYEFRWLMLSGMP